MYSQPLAKKGWEVKQCCFPEGTPVMTALGSTKPIEAIALGDMVLSYNEFTKAYGANPVVNTFVNKTDVLAQVRVNGELIESTTTHPYYTKNAGWKYAGDLKRGDIVLLADGSESIIEESATLRFLDNEISVYNFEVANDHTYFVGNTGVLVHNSGCAAGSLLSNSAGLTGEQLAALLGIGTVAAGGAVAGTIIVDSIFDCLTTKPGNYILDNRIARDKTIRRLLPIESLRMMGFTENDYVKCRAAGVSDPEIYVQAGNSIAVPVLIAVFGQLYGVPWREKVFQERFKTDEQLIMELPLFQSYYEAA